MNEAQATLQTDLNIEMELNMIDASFKELRQDLASLRLNIETVKENIRDLQDCLEQVQREHDFEHNKNIDNVDECYSRDIDLVEADANINRRLDDLLNQFELLTVAFTRHRNGFDKETE